MEPSKRSRRTCVRAGAVALATLGLLGASLGVAWAGANPALTPGATDPRVTNDNIQQTICVRGYTRTVRNVSNAAKHLVYTEYGIGRPDQRRYVIDHLIPLEVGGSNDVKNLWPQPKSGDQSSEAKDLVENELHSRVCADLISLKDAQQVFVIYWGGGNAPMPSPSPPALMPGPAPTVPPANPNGPTARCNDGTYSYAARHQGACSHHGGVAQFYP